MSVKGITCEEFLRDLSPLLDGELSAEAQARMYEHAAACPDCAQALAQTQQIVGMLAHMDDDLAIPEGFRSGWRGAIRALAPDKGALQGNVVSLDKARQTSKADNKKRREYGRVSGWVRALSGIAAAFVVLVGVTAFNRGGNTGTDMTVNQAAIGSRAKSVSFAVNDSANSPALTAGYNDTDTAYYDGSVAKGIEPVFDYSGSDSATSSGILDVEESPSGNSSTAYKVLRSADITIESSAFDDDITAIRSSVAKVGGLFERNATYGESGSRSAQLTLRVPAGFLEMLVDDLQSIGKVTSSEVSAQDISDQYTNSALKLDTLKAQYSRVQQLITEAADLDGILTLEQKASDLQYDIDALTGTLRGWDSHSEMSTVNISMTETAPVAAPVEVSLGEKAAAAFQGSAEWLSSFGSDMVITLGRIVPHLIWIVPVFAIIALVAWQLRKRHPEHEAK